MVCVPALVEVNNTEQLAVPVVPVGVSRQLELLKLPAPLLLKLTLPVGALLVPLAMSVTTAVQVVEPFAWKEDGEQLSVVVVERSVTLTTVLPLLDAWVASPS